MIAGAVFGGLTLAFFMLLVLLSVFGHVVPAEGRFPVVVVLALGSALAVSFLGGDAAAKGVIPIPWVKTHPIAFSVSGGLAVLVIVLGLGYWLYVSGASDGHPEVSLDSVEVAGREDGKVRLTLQFHAARLAESDYLMVEVAADSKFKQLLVKPPRVLDDWRSGQATLAVDASKGEHGWVRLVVIKERNRDKRVGTSNAVEY
jgi:hypothetical protein